MREMHFPVGGYPAFPGFARNADDGIIGFLAADRHVVLEVETENNTLCWKVNLHLASDDICDGLLFSHYMRGGKENRQERCGKAAHK